MAIDAFLKLEGIEGEAQDGKHPKEIDVLAWSWGMSQSGSAHVLGGAGSGKVNVQDLSITKYVDNSSPTLIKFCCNGKHIPTGLLTLRKAGEKPLEYLKISMKDILVSAVSTGGSGGEDRVTENLTLNFGRYELIYTGQKPDGSGGAEIKTQWNMAKNEESFS